jgi:hypothetical protein
MAVRDKGKAKPIFTQIREAITKAVDELFNEHSGEISQVLDEAEDKKINVTFGVVLDCSESEPAVTTAIRFSQSVTDKRYSRLEDPRQILLLKEAPAKEKKDTKQTKLEVPE